MSKQKDQTVEQEGVFDFDFSKFEDNFPTAGEEEQTKEVEEEAEEEETVSKDDFQDVGEYVEERHDDPGPEGDEGEDGNKQEENEVQTDFNYSNLIQDYIKEGIWEDYLVEIDGEEKPLSELKGLDKEKFLEIQKAQLEQKDENYVNISELDEDSRNLLDILKEGGDVTKLLETKKKIIDPLSSYDLDNEQHQIQLVKHMYAVEKGIDDQKLLDRLVKGHVEDLDLEEVARGFAGRLNKYYSSAVEQEKLDLEQKKLEKIEKDKELKKSLKQAFKGLGIKESNSYKPLIDTVFKNKDGEDFVVESDFKKMRENPEEMAEYLLWKYNRKNYNLIVNRDNEEKTVRKNLTRLKLAGNSKTKNRESKPNKYQEKIKEFLGGTKVIE